VVRAFEALVEVRLLADVADPAGATVERALPALGFPQVHGVRIGKAIRFMVEADDEAGALRVARELTERLLANPVIEEAEVSVSEAGTRQGEPLTPATRS